MVAFSTFCSPTAGRRTQINYSISRNPWEVIFPAPVHGRTEKKLHVRNPRPRAALTELTSLVFQRKRHWPICFAQGPGLSDSLLVGHYPSPDLAGIFLLYPVQLTFAVHSGWRLFMMISVRWSSCHLSEPKGRMNVTQNGSDLEKMSMSRRFLQRCDNGK